MEPSDSLVMEIFENQFPDFCGTKGLVQTLGLSRSVLAKLVRQSRRLGQCLNRGAGRVSLAGRL